MSEEFESDNFVSTLRRQGLADGIARDRARLLVLNRNAGQSDPHAVRSDHGISRPWGFAGVQFQPNASGHIGRDVKGFAAEGGNAPGGVAAGWRLARAAPPSTGKKGRPSFRESLGPGFWRRPQLWTA